MGPRLRRAFPALRRLPAARGRCPRGAVGMDADARAGGPVYPQPPSKSIHRKRNLKERANKQRGARAYFHFFPAVQLGAVVAQVYTGATEDVNAFKLSRG